MTRSVLAIAFVLAGGGPAPLAQALRGDVAGVRNEATAAEASLGRPAAPASDSAADPESDCDASGHHCRCCGTALMLSPPPSHASRPRASTTLPPLDAGVRPTDGHARTVFRPPIR